MSDDREGLLELTAADIREVDSRLLSEAEKSSLIEKLYGAPDEWTWKNDLRRAHIESRRWQYLITGTPVSAPTFSLSHKELMFRAALCSRHVSTPTVSDFVDWVYRLYVPSKDYEGLLIGQTAERKIAETLLSIPTHGRWKLIHCGIGANRSAPRSVTALTLNGQALSASPDLVYREKSSGRILIVELKVTQAAIPANGWPNIGAQLWAYSKIPEFESAPSILLTAEIWRHFPRMLPVSWLTYDAKGAEFNERNRELYEAFAAGSHA